jgi:Ser-tRNA(Ala) deacylase AlaX
MQNALYLDDSYLRACSSKVVSLKDSKCVALSQTVFFPCGGGVPWDTGKIVRPSDGAEFQVVAVTKSEGSIWHELSKPGLNGGDEVECRLDWDRRYLLMRMHTAGHVLAAIMYGKSGLLITGNQIGLDKTRFDFSMENFDKVAFQSLVDEANAALARNLEVSVSYLPRDEAMKVPGAVKLAAALPPDVKELRMVRIGEVDNQADGGPHVKNTSEVGKIIFLGAENKGKSNRRIYYSLEP